MSKKFTWNENWKFTKDAVTVSDKTTSAGNWETLDLPHTWNGEDGQDGGSDYYRGPATMQRTFLRQRLLRARKFILSLKQQTHPQSYS